MKQASGLTSLKLRSVLGNPDGLSYDCLARALPAQIIATWRMARSLHATPAPMKTGANRRPSPQGLQRLVTRMRPGQ